MTMTTVIPGAPERGPEPMPRPRSSAVVWINGREAVIAATDVDGMIMISTVDRGIRSESAFLATVVRRTGDVNG